MKPHRGEPRHPANSPSGVGSRVSATCQLSKCAMLEVDSAPVKLPPADAMVHKTCHSNKAPSKLQTQEQEKKKRSLLRPPSHALIPPISVIREHRAELSATLQSFPPANYFTHCMSALLSQFVPLYSSPSVSITHSLFLPCQWIHLYHFSRFRI